MITYGLCCISLQVEKRLGSFQSMTVSQFMSLPRDVALITLGERILHNVRHCTRILESLPTAGIYHYRLSSSMFPVITYEPADIMPEWLPNWPDIRREMACVGELADSLGITCSVHPSQMNVLGSQSPRTVHATISELNFTAWMLDRMGFPRSYETPINIHTSCSKSPPAEVAARFEQGFHRLTDGARDRLVVENEDLGIWSVSLLTEHLWRRLGTPITFDFLHHKCLPGGLSEEAAFWQAAETWGEYTPVFHYAESFGLESKAAMRKHADYCEHRPPDYGVPYTCEIEAKMKDLAIVRMLSQPLPVQG